MQKINVCLSCDDNYSKHAGVVIASILANSNEQQALSFYILDGGISQETKEKFYQLKSVKDCDINFVEIQEETFEDYKNVKTHYYITLPAFYRLKLPSLLPNVDKIIYFDCDFVVCTDLSELYNTKLDNNIIAAVNDKHKKRVKKNPQYINSGMILFDLEKMRKYNIEDEFLKWTKDNFDKIELGDQEIINEVLKGKIKLLPKEWNVQSSNFVNRSTYTNNPKAIHMLHKPWIWASACVHKKEYFKYLQLTPWKLNEEDYKRWTIDNEKASIIKYFKRRPLFFLKPDFYIALWYWITKK